MSEPDYGALDLERVRPIGGAVPEQCRFVSGGVDMRGFIVDVRCTDMRFRYSWHCREMDPRPVVDTLSRHGADFVVVGSAARYLLGEDIVPADVDVVISDSPGNRKAVVDALIELDGYIVSEERLQPLTHARVLPWEWSWKAVTAYGPVDMIVQFIDGTRYQEHDQAAADTLLSDGHVVRCHATAHPQ